MQPERSLVSRALAFRNTLIDNGRISGKKPENGQTRRARGTGWRARVEEGRNMLKKPPQK